MCMLYVFAGGSPDEFRVWALYGNPTVDNSGAEDQVKQKGDWWKSRYLMK